MWPHTLNRHRCQNADIHPIQHQFSRGSTYGSPAKWSEPDLCEGALLINLCADKEKKAKLQRDELITVLLHHLSQGGIRTVMAWAQMKWVE